VSCRITAFRIYKLSGGEEMKKEELIGILKRLLSEEDVEFLHKLDEEDLVKLVFRPGNIFT
jgi:hypothetical protein